jgi:predicted RNA binding protein YcfA (HicA-like mRNA interferase family)
MSGMSGIKANDLEKALKKKGFQLKKGTSKHDQYYFFYKGIRTSIRVSISRGSQYTYNDGAISFIYKEMHLDKKQLLEFVDCQFTESQYIDHLILNSKLD